MGVRLGGGDAPRPRIKTNVKGGNGETPYPEGFRGPRKTAAESSGGGNSDLGNAMGAIIANSVNTLGRLK